MRDFDYIQWAAETRKLVSKYSAVTDELDNLLNFIVLQSQRGSIEEAERLRQLVEKQLQAVYVAKITNALSMPAPKENDGEIVLGSIFQGDAMLHEFKVPLKDFNRHVAVFASAGHGKTTLLINILRQLLEHDIKFLAFDFKQDFRHLKHLPIICLRWDWLRINPFTPPPGVDQFYWITLVCDLFAHVYGWFHASKNYLFEFVNEQYQKHKGSDSISLQKVKEAIENTQDKEFERQRMKTVVLNRLSALLVVCHDVLDCDEGFPICELLNYPVVIEMDECGIDEANFIVSLFLLYVFEYRKAQKHRGSLKHVIVFDEAHRIFYRQAEYRETQVELGPSFIDQIPRVIRDYNEGLIFATQEPSKINNSVMANTDMKLAGNLGNGVDIEAVEKAFQLEKEDTQLIKRLKVGQFMVQKSGTNDGIPFLLQGSDYLFEKSVADDELKTRMKDFISTMQYNPKKQAVGQTKLADLPDISEKASRILEHVGRYPLRSVSHRYKHLGMHPLDGRKAVDELAKSGMVAIKPVQLSPGRPSIYLMPTEMGRLWLEQKRIDTKFWTDYVGHVGLEHRIYQALIGSVLRKLEYTVKKEHFIKRKRFDVYAEKENKRIAMEICVSPKMNFYEALDASKELDEVIFVCKDIQVVQLMQKDMASAGVNCAKFKFVVAHRYLSELYSYLPISENNENKPFNPDTSENKP